jgi:hypothetical protein
VLGSFGLMWALRQTELDEMQVRVFGVTATVLALFLIIPLEFGVSLDTEGERGAAFGGSLALVALWVRGVLRARVSDDFESASRSAMIGIVPIALAAVSQPDVRGPEAWGVLALAYVVLALLVLALYHAGEPGRPLSSLAGQWGGMAAGVVGAALLLALVAALFDPGSLGALSPVGDALRTLGRPLEFVLSPVFRFLHWLFSLIPFPTTEQEFQPQVPQDPEREEPKEQPWSLPIRWIMTGAVVLAIIVGGLLLLAMLFSRMRRGRRDEDESDETEHEGGLKEDLAELFGMLKRPFRRAPRQPSSAIAIRRLYNEMLDRAAMEGVTRAPGTTPSQFAATLGSRYGDELATGVTDAFVASRYGSIEISEERVHRLNQDWQRVSQRQ